MPCVPAAAVPVKRYKKRMEQQIGMCIQDTTAPLLQQCSQLAAAGENTDKKTNEILEEAHNFVMQAGRMPSVDGCRPATYQSSVTGGRVSTEKWACSGLSDVLQMAHSHTSRFSRCTERC